MYTHRFEKPEQIKKKKYFKKTSEKHPKGEKDKSNRLTAGLSAAMEARRQWNSKILNP